MKMDLNIFRDKLLTGFKRFPVTIIFSIFATGLALYNIYFEGFYYSSYHDFYAEMFVCLLGIPLFTAIKLFSERHTGILKDALLIILGIGILALSYFSISDNFNETDVIKVMLPGVAFFCLVFTGAYIGNNEENGFWQFNKNLILRIILAVITGGIIFASLSLALVSIDQLFEFRIDEKFFPMLWAFVAIFFGTVFVHIEIPSEFKKLNQDKSYPVILKNLAAYILLPILFVYLLILITYLGKFLISQSWPSGMVAMPIIAFSMLGLVASILLWPFKNNFSKYFFPVLLPFLGVYFLAFWKRISEYGITEPRYLGVMMGMCLTFVSLYFIFSKNKYLKIIPLTVAVFALLSVYGPWNAFNVSRLNQISRLENILNEYSILVDGKIQKVDEAKVPNEIEVEISSIVKYLKMQGNLNDISDWFSDDATDQYLMLEEMGLNYSLMLRDESLIAAENNSFSFFTDDTEVLDVSSYKYLAPIYSSFFFSGGKTITYNLSQDVHISLSYKNDSNTLVISGENDEDTLNLDLGAFVKKLHEDNKDLGKGTLSRESMSLSGNNEHFEVKLYFNHIFSRFVDEKLDYLQLGDGLILVNLR